MINKKVILDNLYYNIGKQQYDFFLCGTYKKGDEIKFTKWKKYSECIFPIDADETSENENWKDEQFFKQINQRQILPIEVVLDLEDKDQLKPISKTLSEWEQIKDFKIYSTGSRGYHIHIFFKEELSEKEKFKIIKFFGADEQKAGEKCLIALEGVPHWKSGKIKQEVVI